MRDGSSDVLMQAHYAEGDQGGSLREYIDEPVALKLQHGTCTVAQAEADRGGRAKDYNVTTLTLTRRLRMKRYVRCMTPAIIASGRCHPIGDSIGAGASEALEFTVGPPDPARQEVGASSKASA